MRSKLIAGFLLVCLLASLGCVNVGAEQQQVQDTLAYWGEDLSEILSTLSEKQLTEVGSWLILILREYDSSMDYTSFGKKMQDAVALGGYYSPAAARRLALTLAVCGCNSSLVITDTKGGCEKGGIMSMIFALHLLNNGLAAEEGSAGDLAAKILSMQEEDGGWATMSHLSDVDTTAMVLCALAPLKDAEAVAQSIEKGVAFLVKSRLDKGGFCAFGVENAESTAQVLAAMGCLGEEVFPEGWRLSLTQELLSYRTGKGYSHIKGGDVNEMATLQALCAFVSLARADQNQGPLFCYGESILPTDSGGIAAEAPAAPSERGNIRAWICLCVGVGGVLLCIGLWLAGKRNWKNYVFTAGSVLAICLLVIFVNISSVSEHQREKDKPNAIGYVTVGITAAEVTGEEWIMAPDSFPIEADDTVYDILIEASVRGGFTVDSSKGGGVYIRGIGGLYEFDYGPLSGWTYFVNGESPAVGCGSYRLSPGDKVEWIYTQNGLTE